MYLGPLNILINSASGMSIHGLNHRLLPTFRTKLGITESLGVSNRSSELFYV